MSFQREKLLHAASFIGSLTDLCTNQLELEIIKGAYVMINCEALVTLVVRFYAID